MPLFQNESKYETFFYENDFDLHENDPACRTHFHMKGFARRLVLKQRHGKRTRKWPIKWMDLFCDALLLNCIVPIGYF